MNKKMQPGDWVIREGPEVKIADFGAYSGDLGHNQLTMEIGHRDLQNAVAFTAHAVHVIDVTDTHAALFDPYQGQEVIIQLSLFTGTWMLATKVQVEVTWRNAKKMVRQEMLPMLEMVMTKYPYREPRNR